MSTLNEIMSTMNNKTLLEYSSDGSNQQSSPTNNSGGPNDPGGQQSGDDDGGGHYCETYEEERQSERWQELKQEYNFSEPQCGHAIAYLVSEVGAKIRPSTGEVYASQLRVFVDYLHERDACVVDTKFKNIEKFFKFLARNNRTEGTLKGYRAAIINLMKYIRFYREPEPNVAWDWVQEEIRPPQYQTAESAERVPLEKEEVKKLYDELSHRDKLMVQVGVECGPRNSDIRGIKLDDVDLENKQILLHDTKGSDTYITPITDELALHLRRWINVDRKTIPNSDGSEYLFPSPEGGPLTGKRFTSIVSSAAERAGIQEVIKKVPLSKSQKESINMDKDYRELHKVTPHTLRHTFSKLLKDAGISLQDRSNALNHESSATTEEFYDEDDTDYHELMRRLFSGVDSDP